MDYCFIDFETRSNLDLAKVGATCYANHPSTKPLILCGAFSWNRQDYRFRTTDFDIDRISGFSLQNNIFVAHNAQFERAIFKYCLPHWTMPTHWIDTAAMSRRAGLPGSLDGACEALGLQNQKDKRGKQLINMFSKRQRPTKKSGHDTPYFIEPYDRPKEFEEFCEYCAKDVEAERELFYKLNPEIMTPTEYAAMDRNWRANEKGIRIDSEMMRSALRIIEHEEQRASKLVYEISDGQIKTINQNAKIAAFCGMTSIEKNAVSDALKDPSLDSESAAILRLRKDVGRSSVKKLKALESRIIIDRSYDNLIYHGAHTGRETGNGFQPLNMPRGDLGDRLPYAIELIKSGNIETLRAAFGSPLRAISGTLRSLAIPSPGYEFYCVDSSQIEARIVFWFAGEYAALQVFREKGDIYKQLAATIYSLNTVDDVTKEQREVGKRGILGLGYGMGADRFQSSVKQYANLEISKDLAERAKQSYRRKYFRVPRLWATLEQTAIRAFTFKKRFDCAGVAFYPRDQWLICLLPSGRELYYYDPKINADGQLTYMGMESINGKRIWKRVHTYGGKLLENIVQSTARDLLQHFMEQIERAGYEIVLTVYDEILCEKKIGEGSLDQLIEILRIPPEWCAELPLNAEGWKGDRYHK